MENFSDNLDKQIDEKKEDSSRQTMEKKQDESLGTEQELRTKLDEQTDLYIRAVADLENFRKRAQKEREEIRTLITSAIIEDLLPVLDHFELGLQSAETHNASDIVAGFKMVFDQFKNILISYGLSEINPLRQEFNPHEHDCVRREYSATESENIVLSVMRKGYKLHERLIRPAIVIVSTKQQAEHHE